MPAPLRERWRYAPLALWACLWAGLAGDPGAVRLGTLGAWIQGGRAWLPAVAAALVAWPAWRAASARNAPGPLRWACGYAAIGAVASLLVSPRPEVALYWAGMYAAVLIVLLGVISLRGREGLTAILDMNVVLAALLGVGFTLIGVTATQTMSLSGVTNDIPSVASLTMIRETGIGRLAAVAGLAGLARAASPATARRWLWGIAAGLFGVVVIMSQSRSAILGWVLAGALVGWLSVPRAVRWAALVVLALGLAVASLLWLGDAPIRAWSLLSGRETIWRAAMELIKDSPLIGFGFHADRLLLEWPYKNHVSNAVLHAGVQAGLLGLGCFAAAWVAVWRAVLGRRGEHAAGAFARSRWVECAGILALFSVRGLFESSGAFYGVDWLMLAPVWAALAFDTRHAPAEPDGGGALPAGSTEALPVCDILGVRVHPVPLEEAVHRLAGWIRAGDRGRFVVASGMHAVVEAHRSDRTRAMLNVADLFVPDGYSLTWVARRRGFALPRRVCGVDLVRAGCALAAREGYRVFFYGDTEDVLRDLHARLTQAMPTLQVAGTYAPPFRTLTEAEDRAIIDHINARRPDIIWVGLGLPKQEQWILEHRRQLTAAVLVGVGAAFKFLSGRVARAPEWIGEHGLEWLWRLSREPRRLWRRALIDVPTFVSLLARDALQGQRDGDRR